LRTTLVPLICGVRVIAAAVVLASMGAEKATARRASTAMSVARSPGVATASAGAAAVARSQWWSSPLRSPCASENPPARVKWYCVAGRNTAAGCISSNPGSGSSQWIQHGEFALAAKTVVKSHPGMAGLTFCPPMVAVTVNRPTRLERVTGWSKTTRTGASAATDVEPRLGSSEMI
jgi:hypothetical protein